MYVKNETCPKVTFTKIVHVNWLTSLCIPKKSESD